jgi:RNA polymerase sigma factor (sigma-70 family)
MKFTTALSESTRTRETSTWSQLDSSDLNRPDVERDTEGGSNWIGLVERLRAGEETAIVELYEVFCRRIRFHLARQIGRNDLDDVLHDAFLLVVQLIQDGTLRDPVRLMGFARTVLQRTVAGHFERLNISPIQGDATAAERIADIREGPEVGLLQREQTGIMRAALGEMSERDRDILERFYMKRQQPELICLEMCLTKTQFRLIKNRAKSRLGHIGREQLGGRVGRWRSGPMS